MKWDDAYPRLSKLIGKQLRSISGKSDITVISIDGNAISVRGKAGVVKRSISELQKVVEALKRDKPIHVESDVLHGGGSSRNQPETLLANLPDVEWVMINRRKHILWVGKDTHPIGTLKKHEGVEK